MKDYEVIDIIIQKFVQAGDPAYVPYLKGGRTFEARLCEKGIRVDNLGPEPFLPWEVFTETVSFLEANEGHARRGNAIYYKLGDQELSLDTIEGYIAHTVYKKQPGDKVLRRLTSIANILIWAGICTNEPYELRLKL